MGFFHFAQLTPLLKKEDEAFSDFANSLFATYRVACRIFIMLAAFSSIYANLKELKQEEIPAMAALKRQNILKNYLLFISEYVSLLLLIARIDKGLETSDTEYLGTITSNRSEQVKLPNFLEYVRPQALNGTRNNELESLEETLVWNKEQPHVMILGEARQGKTNLVEQFASYIEQKYPGKYKLVKFSRSAFGSNTSFHGQQEEKQLKLQKFFERNPNFILVVDEFHVFVNYGKNQLTGIMGLGDNLKEFLDDNKVRIIGLTTSAEFYRYVNTDPAISGRFPYTIQVKGLSSEVLHSLRLQQVQSLFESLEGIDGIEIHAEQTLKIVELFEQVESKLPNHLKSPYFEKLVGGGVRARIERLIREGSYSQVDLCDIYARVIRELIAR